MLQASSNAIKSDSNGGPLHAPSKDGEDVPANQVLTYYQFSCEPNDQTSSAIIRGLEALHVNMWNLHVTSYKGPTGLSMTEDNPAGLAAHLGFASVGALDHCEWSWLQLPSPRHTCC